MSTNHTRPTVTVLGLSILARSLASKKVPL